MDRSGDTGTWPLIGRQRLLADGVSRLRAGRGSVLCGPAGVGKSRLAREIADRVAAGADVSLAAATGTRAGRAIPLAAMAHLLPVPGDRVDDLGRTLARAGAALIERADGGRLVLVVDDAQWLDDASAVVVGQVAQEEQVAVVATVRTGEPVPDPVLGLWKDGACERVDLVDLDRDEAAALMSHAVAGALDGAAEQRIWDSCRGNPLYLSELLRGALDVGLLVEQSGLWRFTEAAVSTPRLVDLVEARVGGLDGAALDVVSTLAVGGLVPEAIAAEIVDLAPLTALEAAGLVQVVVDRRRRSLALAHPLHEEVLRQRMAVPDRRRIERSLAAALQSVGARRREDVVRLALLGLDGGGPVDPELTTEAARRMAVLHDDRLTERLAGAAVQGGGPVTAHVLHGAALARLGQVQEAEEVLGAAPTDDIADQERVALTVARADNLFWALGRVDDALAAVRGALDLLVEPSRRAELAGNGAVYSFMSGELTTAIDVFDSDLYRAGGRTAVSAGMSLAPALALVGRGVDGAGAARRALDARQTVEESERLTEEPMLRMALAHSLLAAGEIAEAGEVVRAGYDRAVETHDLHGQAWCAMIAGTVAAAAGRISQSARWYAEAAVKFADVGLLPLHRASLAGRAQACAQLGEIDDAAEVRAVVDDMDEHRFPALEPDVLRGLGWQAVLAGDPDAGRDCFDRAAAAAASMGARHPEALALHDHLRLGSAPQVVERLVAVTEGQQGRWTPIIAAHAQADGDGPALEIVAGQFAELGAEAVAAEVFAKAAGGYRSDGDERASARCAHRAEELRLACDGVRSPVFALAGEAGRLTGREREIAEMVAAGRSNQAVADELVVSVRTVESHLARVYRKLGVKRGELGAVLDL